MILPSQYVPKQMYQDRFIKWQEVYQMARSITRYDFFSIFYDLYLSYLKFKIYYNEKILKGTIITEKQEIYKSDNKRLKLTYNKTAFWIVYLYDLCYWYVQLYWIEFKDQHHWKIHTIWCKPKKFKKDLKTKQLKTNVWICSHHTSALSQ